MGDIFRIVKKTRGQIYFIFRQHPLINTSLPPFRAYTFLDAKQYKSTTNEHPLYL